MNNIEEVNISSISDLINDLKKTSTHFWFRGQSCKNWDLLPSAYRNNLLLESQRLNHFRLKAPAFYDKCPKTKEYSKWLSLMQHYGLPTRLLDWTESPLIALFFALEMHDELNTPIVWTLDAGKLNSEMGIAMGQILFLENEEINNKLSKESFEIKENTFKQILAVTPVYEHKRLDIQHSQFTIHGTIEPLNKLENAYKFLKKYVIDNSYISELKSELTILDIRRSKIFPDLENLSKELREMKVIKT